MTVVRFRNKNDMNPFEYMQKFFNNSVSDEDWPGFNHNWAPPVDILENEDGISVMAEIPGIAKEDIKLTVKEGVLTICGEKKHEKPGEKDRYYRSERMYGSFCRSFSLPSNVDANKIKANYKDGVLQIQLPKVEEAKPKEIAIEMA
ncbi:MAG: Hsp20 family protein [candidate division Zixibacteria bacterium]|nr:Hsp20 family protein [candidate division Zixibacteria bacterium]